ncbi:MAG: type II toxin-antitoxin system VapC family toxin [Oceanipulchritudo sp.]
MIGLDTNILVRYIAQDDAAQAARATDIIEGRLTSENPGYICAVVLVEISWVLLRAYKVKPEMLKTVLERLLRTAEFSIEHRDEAWRALRLMDKQGADFADAFLGLINQKQGCEKTLTFDKAAGALAFFEVQPY